MIGVVTTLNKKLYKQYGHKFFDTYNWPFNLIVYSEDLNDIPNSDIVIKSIFDEIPQCEGFVNRNKTKPVADTPSGYINDGVRFSYKVYAYTNEIITNEDYKGLICIDADSVFHKKIDEEWIKKHIHRDDCMMTYLGRGNHYSECGFLYFNLNHADTLAYANRMKSLYDTDGIYNLKEQHDSFIWDYVRKEFENRGTKNYNIGDGKMGHVQARSILGTVYDHTKGPRRKAAGKSAEFKL